MMKRIDLLPASYADARRQKMIVASVMMGGLGLVVLTLLYWFALGAQVSSAQSDLEAVQAANASLQTRVDELQRFATLEDEALAKQDSLESVMAGDIAWPSLMNNLAMVIPGEVWLTGVQASAGTTEGASTVGTETAAVRVSEKTAYGRIQFNGNAMEMPAVAKWLIRLADTKEFEAVWLNGAEEVELEPGVTVFEFDSTVELNAKAAASHDYLEDLP